MATVYKTNSSLGLDTPVGVAVNPDLGQVLICDYGNDQLMRVELGGFKEIDTTDTYAGGDISQPIGVCYYDGHYYVALAGNHTLARFRARDMAVKDYFGTHNLGGSATSKLQAPTDVCTDREYLYVADYGNNRIMKLKLSTLEYVTHSSSINGAFQPYGVCYKSEGGKALFIASDTTGNKRVIKCKPDLTYIEQNNTNLTEPYHLTCYNDFVYVADASNVIVVLKSDGLTQQTTQSDTVIELDTPAGIESYCGALLIADTVNDRITAWRAYNPRDAFTSATPMKVGGSRFDNPFVIVGEDSLIVGDTQEGTPNRWKEENLNHYELGWTKETALTAPSWSES